MVFRVAFILLILVAIAPPAAATPANRASLQDHYGRFLPKKLDGCVTCHQPIKLAHPPRNLAEFPHNPFGARLAALGKEMQDARKGWDIPSRLKLIAAEDADGDGIRNQDEILLGFLPGSGTDRPTKAQLDRLPTLRSEFAAFLAEYRWRPFEPVRRPGNEKRKTKNENPIDSFIGAEHIARGLRPRPEAARHVLLRRVYLDLIGLTPTPEEVRAFEADRSPDAYEKVVDRLLASPRYGERWGRHWMDVWRYSDWAGWMDQVRDSKPHIWRWRDWIIESLNKDKPYDRMVQEMLAADELTPTDSDALRATGYLVRNFKLLSREQWMEDVVGHTSRAFLGVTLNCAKCHDHMTDPFTQADYYRVRAIFETHNVRTDRIPGQADVNKDGLARAFDADLKAVTYLYPRGDERHPDKERPMAPGVPPSLGGEFKIEPVKLPLHSYRPHRREFEVKETLAASESAVEMARKAVAESSPDKRVEAQLKLDAAESAHRTLLAQLKAEEIEDSGGRDSADWKKAAESAVSAQRLQGVVDAKLALLLAQNAVTDAQAKADSAAKENKQTAEKASAALTAAKTKLGEAEKALKAAESEIAKPLNTEFKPRVPTNYPAESSGRRSAFARWLTDVQNPLTARVAVNHIWARHFGEGLVPTLDDFGRKGRRPSMPKLLDWLAAELMKPTTENGKRKTDNESGNPSAVGGQPLPWSMKHIHRLIVTSATYRMDSKPDPLNLAKDPDNRYLWRMPSRRLEAELVRDNVLHVSGALDLAMGGPEVDHRQGLQSKRRSVYLRVAAEKEVEFLKIFDGPSVTECYARKQSVIPQQALALANSEIAITQSRALAQQLTDSAGSDNPRFIREAFLRILSRKPTKAEIQICAQFLADQSRFQPSGPKTVSTGAASGIERARRNLILSLLNHNDFLTVR